MTAVPVLFAGTDGIFTMCKRGDTRTIGSAEALLFYFKPFAYACHDSRVVGKDVFRLFHNFVFLQYYKIMA